MPLPVISQLDIPIPNAIRVSPDQKKLYVTNRLSAGAESDQAYATTAGSYIYAYDLNEAGFLVNKRMFGLVRTGYAKGIQVDDEGRVWTAEGEGIVARDPATGKILRVFNASAFGIESGKGVQISSFALAGDTLFIVVAAGQS